MRLGILVSGRGSNLEAVLRAVAEGRLPGVEPVIVVANRPDILALEVAARFGVPWQVMATTDFADADARDAAIGTAVRVTGCDLVLLAGYDQLLRRGYFAVFAGRTINVHPSLLPRHGGRGMMGLAVHEAVVAARETETGVTIHEVTEQLDRGPAITQVRIRVEAGTTAAELAERVLEVEHRTVVEVIARLSASMSAAPPAPNRVRR
jgi:phosphoribosylglycinamide formyltransferase-1